MGVIKRGILGGFSGRVAGVVGSSWKGIAYMKALPLSVANPKTASQTAQRTAFAYAVSVAKQINSGFIKPMWDRFAVQMSGYNDFVGTNVKLYDGTAQVPATDFVGSKGKMASTAIGDASYNPDTRNITVAWVDDSGEGLKEAGDGAYCFAVDDDGIAMAFTGDGAIRSDEELVGNFSAGVELKKAVEIFIGFRRPDGTVVSDSSSHLWED